MQVLLVKNNDYSYPFSVFLQGCSLSFSPRGSEDDLPKMPDDFPKMADDRPKTADDRPEIRTDDASSVLERPNSISQSQSKICLGREELTGFLKQIAHH